MLMSLPEVFPNPGPITSTPKKPSSTNTVTITSATSNNIELDEYRVATIGNRSQPSHHHHHQLIQKLHVRSCPVSPIETDKQITRIECNGHEHQPHEVVIANSKPSSPISLIGVLDSESAKIKPNQTNSGPSDPTNESSINTKDEHNQNSTMNSSIKEFVQDISRANVPLSSVSTAKLNMVNKLEPSSSAPFSPSLASAPTATKTIATPTTKTPNRSVDQRTSFLISTKSLSTKQTNSIPGYRTVQNRLKNDPKSIKQRLLSALTDMIPHKETLSLRLLVNYTIDDKDTECLVIDETLCRQEESSNEQKSHGKRGPKDRNSLDRDDSGLGSEISESETKRLKVDQLSSTNETHVLDLSLHLEKEDQELNEAMSTEPEELSDEGSRNAAAVENIPKSFSRNLSLNTSSGSGPATISTTNGALGGITSGPSMMSTTHTLPFLDSAVLTLLPLLQQQQQQQQRQSCRYSTPIKPSVSMTSKNTMGQNTPETAEMLLLKELQALLNAPNSIPQANTTTLHSHPLKTLNDAITLNNAMAATTAATATSANMPGITSTISTGISNSVLDLARVNGIGEHPGVNLISSAHLAPPSITSTPLIGFPLLHQFNADSMNAVQALLPTTASNFASFNFSPTAVLSVKDKSNCLSHQVSTAPGTKSFTQPVVSLLNQISVSQTAPISLRTTLSTLSQLFAGSSTEGTGPASVSAMKSNEAETKKFSLDTLTTSPTGTNGSKLSRLSGSCQNTMDIFSKQILLKTMDSAVAGQNNRPSQETEVDGSHSATCLINAVTTGGRVTGDGQNSSRDSATSTPMTTTTTTINLPTNAKNSLHTSPNNSNDKNNHAPENPKPNRTSTNTTTQPTSNGTTYSTNQFMFGRRLNNTRRFVCNQCRKNFASLAELNRHTLEAHNSFKCTICSAHFTQRSNLQRHSLKHVGFKPFTCNLCKKEYYRKDHLVRHIEVTHPNHDPKMNITVHLTSSECLDYLDRLHAGKQTPSSSNDSTDLHETTEEDPEELMDLEEMRIEEAATTTGLQLTETNEVENFDEGSVPVLEND